MSQQEDLLFCKIAIQSGLVTQADAKKCLAYSQKLEAQGKMRPRIGAVFVKANILTQQNASRIYQAVNKRSGAKGIALREPVSRTEHPGWRERHATRRKPMDPRVMWIGIGSGVVLLVAVMFMVIMILNAAKKAREVEQRALQEESSSTGTRKTGSQLKESLGVGADEKQQVPLDSDTRKQFEKEHIFALMDARSLRGDSYYKALTALGKFKEEKQNRYNLFADLDKQITELIDEIRNDMKSEVDATVEEARTAAAGGDRAEAQRLLNHLKDKVDPPTKDLIDEKLAEILSQTPEKAEEQ